MSLLLAVSEIYVPRFVCRHQLEALFEATAEAFRVSIPHIKTLSFEDCLGLYAGFTRDHAELCIKQGNEEEGQSRLFRCAYLIGQHFRATLYIKTMREVMRMGTVIYKMLHISFQGDPAGNIIINRCFFSAYYSGRVCRLVSSLDEGLLAGLAGGGKLSFSQRITEGHQCCRAHFKAEAQPS